jgi:DNA-binding transcriptional LysR family regulator
MDRIDTLRAFLAVAQEGSFTCAARRLGLSVKLVSKRVAALEGELGAQLFARTTRSVSLTDAGRACRDRASPLVEQFDEFEDALRDRQGALAGTIRITAPTGFGSRRLPAALAPFLAAHPQVEAYLSLSNRRVDLAAEGFDLAIRVGAPGDTSMIGRRLASMPFIVCAAPDYLARAGTPTCPTDLASHSCLIDENAVDAALWRFRPAAGGAEVAVRVSGHIRANAPAPLADFALAGLGIVRSPAYVVGEAVGAGRLRPLLSDHATGDAALYALYPPNRHMPMRVRALLDHLAIWFAATRWVSTAAQAAGSGGAACESASTT